MNKTTAMAYQSRNDADSACEFTSIVIPWLSPITQ